MSSLILRKHRRFSLRIPFFFLTLDNETKGKLLQDVLGSLNITDTELFRLHIIIDKCTFSRASFKDLSVERSTTKRDFSEKRKSGDWGVWGSSSRKFWHF